MKHIEWYARLSSDAQSTLEDWATIGPPNAEYQKHYTAEEAARALRLTSITIRQYVREGRIFARKLGRKWLIPEDAIARFMYNSSHTEPADPDIPMGVLFLWSDKDMEALADYTILSAKELEEYANRGEDSAFVLGPHSGRYKYELSSVIACQSFLEQIGLLEFSVGNTDKLSDPQYRLTGPQLHGMNELVAREWFRLPLDVIVHEYKSMFGKEPDSNDLRLLRTALITMMVASGDERGLEDLKASLKFGSLAAE